MSYVKTSVFLDDSVLNSQLLQHSFSRFDSMITFGLPDRPTRQEIAAQYAKHLTESELDELAAVTDE